MLRRLLPPLVLALLALPPTAGAAMTPLQSSPAVDPAADSARVLLRKAEAVASGRRRADGEDLTTLLRQVALKLPELSGKRRERARDLLERPTMGDKNGADIREYSVEEAAPICSEHFCIHYVPSTRDKPASDSYVQTMAEVFEHVYQVENVEMGWRVPKPDGSRGCPGGAASCMNRTDVYIQDIGDDGLYGYASVDPGQQTLAEKAYLVLDNDYAERIFAEQYPDGPIKPMQVTAAHEYNHVLQYGYSVAQETWMYEASASWVEEKVYSDINDYFQYMESWAQLTTLPLTNEIGSTDEYTGKTYGNAVWNQWVDAKAGQDTIRGAWENALKVKPRGFSPKAYDVSLRARGLSYFKAFTGFAVDTAEWRASNSVFDAEDHPLFPDVRRVRDQNNRPFRLVADSGGGVATLLHSSYALVDVAPTSSARLKLVGNMPRGARGAIALIGRVGDPVGGAYVVRMNRLPRGGTGTITLEDPSEFSRVTAALINGDARTSGRTFGEDWNFIGDRDTNNDGIEDTGPPLSVLASTDFDSPVLEHRSPARGKHRVSRRAPVKVTFSEPMAFANTRSAVLRGPGSHKVRATVKLSGRKLEIRPRKRLRARTRYTVKLSSDITDRGGNPLPRGSREWQFTTAR